MDPPRCQHCGNAVDETRHSRTGYTVGGFALHTGETEEAVFRRQDADEGALVYRRLVRPVLLYTCRACYADARRRRLHESWDFPLALD
jgi:hypothetical protein